MDSIRARFPLGTWVRGHVHGNEFSGRVTGWGSDHGIIVEGVSRPASRVIDVVLEPVLDAFLDDDDDHSAASTPREAT